MNKIVYFRKCTVRIARTTPWHRCILSISLEEQDQYVFSQGKFGQTFRRSSIVNQSSWDNNIVRSRSIFFAVSSSDSTGSFVLVFLLVRVFDAFCLFDDFGYTNKAYFRIPLK